MKPSPAEAPDSLAFYRKLYEYTPNAIVVFGLHSKEILAANPALDLLLDHQADSSCVGRPLWSLLGDQQQEAMRDALEAAIKNHEEGRPAGRRRVHWQERIIEFALAWPPAEFFGQAACILTLHDVTEREQFKGELERYQAQLESLVEERTTALRAAMREAEAANHAKGIFLSNMSHELRTPLNAILGFSRLLQREPSIDGKHRQKIEAIQRAGEHLLALINDVLELSRSDKEASLAPPTVFSLNELLQEIERDTRQQAEARQLRFTLTAPALPANVQGHPEGIRRVLQGLLGNALKYTRQGGIELRIVPYEMHLRFEVRDTGPGIPPEEREHIFQPFCGKSRGEGTGLGLYLGREYARLMGGDLTLGDSDPSAGCVFVLNLPLPAAAAPAGSPAPIGLADNTDPPHLLVVDDQADNRWLATQLLQSWGFTVTTAENGKEAIAAFSARPPDMIWMDMRMPVLGGPEATQQIRALPGGEQVKIVAMTASTLQEERAEILAAGCNAIISKPLDETEIAGVLQQLLEVRYRHASPAKTAAPAASDSVIPRLPAALQQRLKQAAATLDMDECQQIADELAAEQDQAAPYLQNLLVNFRFDLIEQWCVA